jgi:nucleoside-diphosphate-sugar epimerase
MPVILSYDRVKASRGVGGGDPCGSAAEPLPFCDSAVTKPARGPSARERDGEGIVKVFVTGATGVLGRSAVRGLLASGHDVIGLARDADKAALLDAMDVLPVRGTMFDLPRLAEAFEGCDVVCNMATRMPIGWAGMRPGAWRVADRLRSEGARIVAGAARRAGVGRLVQESVSYLYADAGDDWIDEGSPVAVNGATEPVILAETAAEEFRNAGRDSVILRFGAIVGDDGLTRWRLRRARTGRPIGLGSPDGWTHVIHADDVGTAVVASLRAPSGIYNAGAAPVRRCDLVAAYGQAAGMDDGAFCSRVMQRLGGERLEPMTRSQRVSSAALGQAAAWQLTHPAFEPEWLVEVVRA